MTTATRFHATFQDYVAPSGWRLSTALQRLGISTEEFNYTDNENADGYSHDRVIAIRPDPKLWSVPIIAAHELAHIVLGHTEFAAVWKTMDLFDRLATQWPGARFEFEAHTVAKAVAFGLHLSPEESPVQLVEDYIASTGIERAADSETPLALGRATLIILDAGFDSSEVLIG